VAAKPYIAGICRSAFAETQQKPLKTDLPKSAYSALEQNAY